jgi:hypothetical protein
MTTATQTKPASKPSPAKAVVKPAADNKPKAKSANQFAAYCNSINLDQKYARAKLRKSGMSGQYAENWDKLQEKIKSILSPTKK